MKKARNLVTGEVGEVDDKLHQDGELEKYMFVSENADGTETRSAWVQEEIELI